MSRARTGVEGKSLPVLYQEGLTSLKLTVFSPGTVMWGGAPNIKWFLDRSKGLCGFFGAAMLPSGDPTYVEVEVHFEKAMYEMAGKCSPGS